MEAYETCMILGQGTYGVVYKGKCKITGMDVAIKKTKYNSSNEGIPSNTLREISLLKNLSHPNIVKLLDIVCVEKSIYLIFECLNYDLKQYISENGAIDESKTRSFLFQLLKALSYCHSNRVIHRDIKPQNILLSTEGTVKLADFGLARTYNVPVKRYTQEVVTLWYRSPEILMDSYFYSTSVDMWSVGCIFSEMINGKPLFTGNSEIDQLFKIFQILGTPHEKNWPGINSFKYYQQNFPNFPSKDLASLHNRLGIMGNHLLLSLLEYVPSKRLSAKAALDHAFFNVYNSIR